MTAIRSRQFTDLTNYEIEKYLEHNDIIVIPVGNCETHAGYPVDCEFIAAKGYAQLIAEKVDGLVLPNVVYFNPGGTQIGRGTIHMSMTESLQYTKELAHSLLNQGFRRQIWIPSHVPTSDFLLAMVTEFFDEAKVPMLFLDVNAYFQNLGIAPPMSFDPNQPQPTTKSSAVVNPFEDTMLAGYLLDRRLDIVPAKGDVDFPPLEEKPLELFPDWFPEYSLLSKCSRTMGAPAPFYYSKPADHCGPAFAKYTREELEQHAKNGEEYMREMIDKARLDDLMAVLRHLQDYMKEIVEKNYDHLPKNRFSSANPFH